MLSFSQLGNKFNFKKYFSVVKYFRSFQLLQFSRKYKINKSLMELTNVVKRFEDLISPNLAESWDNTGLLLEPLSSKLISTIFLTNDLTEAVLEEALLKKADMIISYHPPIFSAFKSLRKDKWKDRIVMKCIENSIAIYSPHTACDAAAEGVNDWLINCFALSNCNPIKQSVVPVLKYPQQIDFSVPNDYEITHLKTIPGTELLQLGCNEGFKVLRLMGNKSSLTKFVEVVMHDEAYSSISMTSCESLPYPSYGMGRIGNLKVPLTIKEAVSMLKIYLGLAHLRVAIGSGHTLDTPITSVAVCAGSGATLLRDVAADLYVTGEMSHHDLLDANHNGRSVILCEHSNSERGYLKVLAGKLEIKVPGISFVISQCDKDPVTIM